MRLIAELSNAHNGDLARALRLLDAAKAAGATDAKIQAYTPDELVALRGDGPAPEPWGSEGWTMRSLYERARTPLEWVPTLFDHARAIGLPLFASVFGPESLAACEAAGCPEYKLAALDYGRADLFGLVLATGKPVIRSGRTPRAEPCDALMVWCPAGYPQGEAGLSALGMGYRGFSYHGTDPDVPAAAALLYAEYIECHFHLEAEPSELEADVSLNEGQFRRFTNRARWNRSLL